jgi:hypothetical protein
MTMRLSARPLLAAACAASAALAACSNNDGPTGNDALSPTGIAASTSGATSLRVSFTGRDGDTRYIIQRAPGASGGEFAPVGEVTAQSGTTAYTFVDNGLVPRTTYRYRVAAVRGSVQSAWSDPFTATTGEPGSGGVVEISQDITASRTLYADTTYRLRGYIHVANGATLTIQPGTTVQGDFSTLGSSLFIMRGAKIQAAGTAEAPIVFTSSRPAGQRQAGDWGGLIIVGNGLINRTGDIEIEGTGTVASGTPSGQNYRVLYSGGTANDDDSGELRYVRVEYAGFAPSLNNELNSFTFGAVGSRTKLSYLQVLAGLDDSFEWFGGAVDADHLVSYESGDDHYDMSEGYSGRLQYLIAFQSTVLAQRDGAGQPSTDPQGIENDGCNGTGCTNGFNATPLTVPVVANFTLIGTGSTATSGSSGGVGMMLRRGTGGWYVNGVVARYPRGGVSLRDPETYARAGGTGTPDLATADLAIRSVLFAENSAVFQTGGSNVQNTLDLGANGLTASTATTASLVAAFPTTVGATTTAAAFDWAPAANAPIATGGLATFSGKLAARVTAPLASGNGALTGTTFVGAAQPGGAKWWAGWTRYAQN